MYEKSLEVLNILTQHGYDAYIVGGYVRDKVLDIKSNDIDIASSATPKEIMGLFDALKSDASNYGVVKIIYKKYKYEITTFRQDMKYKDNRRPEKVKYIKDIKNDLLRRDFTINTLCIDKDGRIIDYLKVQDDLQNKIIKTVGNPRYRFKEDVLRILRAIRFAVSLDFCIDKKTENYMIKYGYLLKKLSYVRKKDELSKIFSVKDKEKARELINKYKLTKYLELSNLDNIILCDDILGIWAQLNVDDIYPFSKYELKQMKDIRYLLELKEIDNYTLYKYGCYLCMIVCQIKNMDVKEMTKRYNELIIKGVDEIEMDIKDIPILLEKEPGKYLKDIIIDIERKIIDKDISNNYKDIKTYIIGKYK